VSKLVKALVVATVAAVIGGFWGSSVGGAAGLDKGMPKATAASQEKRVVDTMRQMGFAVDSARHMGEGRWEVQVSGFDARRATGAFRGAIVAPAAQALGTGHAAATREAGKLGPRGGGGVRSAEDGSATGGGNSGSPENSGGGRGGEPLPGSDANEGGSATGGGSGGSPEPGTNPRGQAAALRVAVTASGALEIDASSLRQAGFANTVGETTNGQVSFR
jgi:hypothetical protein